MCADSRTYTKNKGRHGTLEQETRELSHFLFGLKLVLSPKAVTLHWPVLLGQQGASGGQTWLASSELGGKQN